MRDNQKNRRSIRVPDYDYTTPGAYLVTICTLKKECILGDISEGSVQLTEIGQIVLEQWMKTGRIRSCVKLDKFIIMPNHLHGIVIIHNTGTARRAPTPERFGKPAAGSLPTIIRSFKSAATKRINVYRGTPGAQVWQRGFFEHMVRNREDLNRIREYILNNPARWELDRENPER